MTEAEHVGASVLGDKEDGIKSLMKGADNFMNLDRTRPSAMLDYLYAAYGDTSVVGIEVGVFKAAHAECIMETLNIQKLYLIDPYPHPGDPDNRFQGIIKDDIPAAKEFALDRMAQYGDRVQWLYLDGDEGLDRLAMRGIEADFVYIDGLHDSKSVSSNIRRAFATAKEGGYIGGHDYLMREEPPIQVKAAVDSYIQQMGFRLNVAGRPIPDWWFQKNRGRWLQHQIRKTAAELADNGLTSAATRIIERAMSSSAKDVGERQPDSEGSEELDSGLDSAHKEVVTQKVLIELLYTLGGMD